MQVEMLRRTKIEGRSHRPGETIDLPEVMALALIQCGNAKDPNADTPDSRAHRPAIERAMIDY